MDESLFDSEGINLRYDKGSVGEFLQRGKAGLSMYNAWQLPLLLAFVLVAVAGVMHLCRASLRLQSFAQSQQCRYLSFRVDLAALPLTDGSRSERR